MRLHSNPTMRRAVIETGHRWGFNEMKLADECDNLVDLGGELVEIVPFLSEERPWDRGC